LFSFSRQIVHCFVLGFHTAGWLDGYSAGIVVVETGETTRGGGDSVVTFRAKHNANSGGQKGATSQALSRHAFWVGENQREWMYILKERIIGAQKTDTQQELKKSKCDTPDSRR
jgi:hypothetical protein